MIAYDPISRLVRIEHPDAANIAVGFAFERVMDRVRALAPRVTGAEIEGIRRAVGELEAVVRAEGIAFIVQAAALIDQRGPRGFLLSSGEDEDGDQE